MVNIKQTEEFDRPRAIVQAVRMIVRWFPPEPLEMVTEIVDVIEAALKQVLPGYHVRVSVEKIETGIEG